MLQEVLWSQLLNRYLHCHEYFTTSASQCHLYYCFFGNSICHSLLLWASPKMSNEIFIQFHILEKITIGNLNIKYIEFYKVSVVLQGSQINYGVGISRPEIWAASVIQFWWSTLAPAHQNSLWIRNLAYSYSL